MEIEVSMPDSRDLTSVKQAANCGVLHSESASVALQFFLR
jgi:hypothetical protein